MKIKLYVNEKLLSVHNKFYVRDENNNKVYEFSSKVISMGSKTTITDIEGNKIAYIEQEILHLTPNYNVYIDDKFEFKITKKFHLLKNDYSLSIDINDTSKKELVLAIIVAIANDINRNQNTSNN